MYNLDGRILGFIFYLELHIQKRGGMALKIDKLDIFLAFFKKQKWEQCEFCILGESKFSIEILRMQTHTIVLGDLPNSESPYVPSFRF